MRWMTEERGLSGGTVKNRRWHLAQFLDWLHGRKLCVADLDLRSLDAYLQHSDRRTSQRARDHTLLLFLYKAGARADEAARLTVADLDLGPSPAVRILGKGNKTRLCPLWTSTASALRFVAGRGSQDRVFLNRRREGMTRFGIYPLVRRVPERVCDGVSES